MLDAACARSYSITTSYVALAALLC